MDFKETAYESISCDDVASFTSGEVKWIRKIQKLHKEYPNDVQIIALPEDNDGVIFAHIPKSWCKIAPPKKMNFTEEQKQVRAERMREVANKRKEQMV